MKRLIVIIALSLVFFPSGARADRLAGKVISIGDAHLLKVQLKGRKQYVRLWGITCAERKEPAGEKARKFSGDNSFGKTVVIIEKTEPRREEIEAEVILPSGVNLNHQLVKEGLCKWDRETAPQDKDLEKQEKEAVAHKRGVWAN